MMLQEYINVEDVPPVPRLPRIDNKVDVQNNILHTLREASYVGKK